MQGELAGEFLDRGERRCSTAGHPLPGDQAITDRNEIIFAEQCRRLAPCGRWRGHREPRNILDEMAAERVPVNTGSSGRCPRELDREVQSVTVRRRQRNAMQGERGAMAEGLPRKDDGREGAGKVARRVEIETAASHAVERAVEFRPAGQLGGDAEVTEFSNRERLAESRGEIDVLVHVHSVGRGPAPWGDFPEFSASCGEIRLLTSDWGAALSAFWDFKIVPYDL